MEKLEICEHEGTWYMAREDEFPRHFNSREGLEYIAQLEAKIASYREAYEQAVEAASQGWNVSLPDLDGMLAWIEEKR